MHTRALLVAATLAALVPTRALADDAPAAAPPATPESAIAPTPTPAPAPESTPTLTLTTCALGDHDGIDDSDASTARRLVCDEIVRDGAPPGSHFHVNLGKLGGAIILSVSREGDSGAVADTRELRLSSIEEVSVAGPRLADALVHGEAITQTETTENLVGEETRVPKEKPGKLHFAVGLMGLMPPFDQGLGLAAGGLLDLHYEAARIELVGGMRGGGNSSGSGDPSMGYFMLPLGARYHFTDQDIAPYVGGGLEWMALSLNVPSESFSGNNNGLGGYADAGIEMLRTHHAHFAVGARIDMPFFSLQNDTSNAVAYGSTSNPAAGSPNKLYYAPFSLEVRLTF